jgi:hypothetical protein
MRKPRPWRLTPQMATQRIRERAANSANVLLTLHAQEQMAARDIIAPEVFRILREGAVRGSPVQEGDEWRAIMELRMPGGRDAATVTVLAAGDRLRVVTVMWKDRR